MLNQVEQMSVRSPARPLGRVIVLSGFSALLAAGCAIEPILKHTPGTTLGSILVGEPQISSRERLVNDRLTQERWLSDQLAHADDKEFGIQGASDIRTFEGFTARAAVRQDTGAYRVYREQQDAIIENTRSQRDVLKLKNDVDAAYLRKQLQRIESGDAPVENPRPPTAGSFVANLPQVSSLDDARYAASLGATVGAFNQLIGTLGKGNPARTTATVSPRDEFRARLSFRNEIRDELLDNALDDRHDLRGNSLYRMHFKASVLPSDDTSAWAVVKVRVSAPASFTNPATATRLHQKWLSELSQEINRGITATYRALVDFKSCNDSTDSKDDTAPLCQSAVSYNTLENISAASQMYLEKSDCPTTWGNALKQVGKASESAAGSPQKLQPFRFRSPEADSSSVSKRLFGADIRDNSVALMKRCSAELTAVFGDKRPDKLNQHKWVLHRLIADAFVEQYKRSHQDYAQIGTPSLNFRVGVTEGGKTKAAAFSSWLTNSMVTSGVYVYSTTPVETVERISDVAGRRIARSIGMSLSLLGAGAGGEFLTQWADAGEGLFEAIRLQPLVVGFQDIGQPNGSSGGTGVAGWILGPRFSIANDGKSARFRHLPRTEGVSALVSLPAWWPEAKIEVQRYWVSEKGCVNKVLTAPASGCILTPPTDWEWQSRTIPFDQDLSALTEALSSSGERAPQPGAVISQVVVEVGKPASIVIPGQHLWRGTTVTLGGQPASSVTVLPDMRGILAKWDKVDEPLGTGQGEHGKLPVMVWTSQGHVEHTLAEVRNTSTVSSSSGNPKIVPSADTRIILGDAENVIELDRPLVSAVAKVRLMSPKRHVVAEGLAADLDDDRSKIKFKLDDASRAAIKKLDIRTLVPSVLFQRQSDASLTEVRPAVDTAWAYFGKAEEASLEAKIDWKVALKDSRLTLTFPPETGTAYPSIDPLKVKPTLKWVVDEKRTIPFGLVAVGNKPACEPAKQNAFVCRWGFTLTPDAQKSFEAAYSELKTDAAFTLSIGLDKASPIQLKSDTIPLKRR